MILLIERLAIGLVIIFLFIFIVKWAFRKPFTTNLFNLKKEEKSAKKEKDKDGN